MAPKELNIAKGLSVNVWAHVASPLRLPKSEAQDPGQADGTKKAQGRRAGADYDHVVC